MVTEDYTEMDVHYMQRALDLAQKGWGLTNPNPLVGCVVVRDGRVLSEGWHKRYGDDHAEAMALNPLSDAEGATLYVTLEPCNHTGKTPPCTELILRKGVRRVVYALEDPNPIAGGGADRLAAAGVWVRAGLLREEAAVQNEIFRHWITRTRPFVALKYAMTLDGRIAAATGDSRWVTGQEARREVHALRQRYSAILVGSGTVLADNPELSVRDWAGEVRQPLRIVLDARRRIPLSASVFQNQHRQKTLLVTAEDLPAAHRRHLEAAGVTVWHGPLRNGRLDLTALLCHLKQLGCDSVLVEGGAAVHGSFLDQRLADRVYAHIAPKLIGGSTAPGPVGGRGHSVMDRATVLKDVQLSALGSDWAITGIPVYQEGEDVHRIG